MKTYIFRYSTNYNLGVVVVNAESLDEAKEYAKKVGAWDTNDYTEIDSSKEGIIISNSDNNNY